MQSPSRRSNRRPSMNLIDQVSDQLPLDGTRHLYLVTAIVPQCPGVPTVEGDAQGGGGPCAPDAG
jgi:hypothetical protein